jgi:hypothetical protein
MASILRPGRGTTLAALVFVAVAAPVTAYALAAGDDAAPPAHGHAHDAHGHGAAADKHVDKDKAKKADHGTDRADEASAAGRAHARAMKAWAHCVAEAASGQKTGDRTGPPKDACDDKPLGPGRAKHLSGHKPGHSGEHGRSGR